MEYVLERENYRFDFIDFQIKVLSYMNQKFGAGIWHFATYVDRYNTEGYGEPRSVLDAIKLAGQVKDLSVVDINYPYFGGSFSNQEIKDELDKVNL